MCGWESDGLISPTNIPASINVCKGNICPFLKCHGFPLVCLGRSNFSVFLVVSSIFYGQESSGSLSVAGLEAERSWLQLCWSSLRTELFIQGGLRRYLQVEQTRLCAKLSWCLGLASCGYFPAHWWWHRGIWEEGGAFATLISSFLVSFSSSVAQKSCLCSETILSPCLIAPVEKFQQWYHAFINAWVCVCMHSLRNSWVCGWFWKACHVFCVGSVCPSKEKNSCWLVPLGQKQIRED